MFLNSSTVLEVTISAGRELFDLFTIVTCVQPRGEYIYHGYVHAHACEASRRDSNGESG